MLGINCGNVQWAQLFAEKEGYARLVGWPAEPRFALGTKGTRVQVDKLGKGDLIHLILKMQSGDLKLQKC